MLAAFVNACLQVILFLIIPFVWWLVTARKKVGFLKWIGLKKPRIQHRARFLLLFLLSFLLLSIPPLFLLPMFVDPSLLATSQFAILEGSVVIPILLYAFVQTGLSEELFFRGFLAKRLISRFGFHLGNLLQGFLFGGLHGVMLYQASGIAGALVILLFTGFIGWVMGWMNERSADGSILPSWLLHGCANSVASLFALIPSM